MLCSELDVKDFPVVMAMKQILSIVVITLSWLSLPHPLAAGESPSFTRHVSPLLFKLGCSAGSCHGSFAGKGGMQLSLFSSRPELDYKALRHGGNGRRVDLANPANSLMLRKPTAAVNHGGGALLTTDDDEYRVLHDWLRGSALDDTSTAVVTSVRLEPSELTLAKGASQNLRVLAKRSDGIEEDVTFYAKFESLDASIAVIDMDGRTTAVFPGDTPLLAHYAGHVVYATVAVPAETVPGLSWPDEQPTDVVDLHINEKLQRLNIVASPQSDDAEFLRRVYLDTISVLPTPEETHAFLADKSPDKRAKLIDQLLEHPLHAAQWATKMCDLIGADSRFIPSYIFHDWFRNKFERNLTWDKIAFGILCATAADDRTDEQLYHAAAQARKENIHKKALDKAKGLGLPLPPPLPPTAKELAIAQGLKPWQYGDGAKNTLSELYRTVKFLQVIPIPGTKDRILKVDAKALALQTSNALLGVQLTCAQCHKHPTDKWTQRDFIGFAAVFTHVAYAGVSPKLKRMGVNISGPHAVMTPVETFDDPATGEPIGPKVPEGPAIEVKEDVDPRKVVWQWMVDKKNPYFARAMVNRVWAHYLGRGFFEPVDSQAAANPPSHPEVLDELARDFLESGFDIRRLERRVMNTLAYQRTWRTNASNAADDRNGSHHPLRRLTAEQVLEAVLVATGTTKQLSGVYHGRVRPEERVVEMSATRFKGDDGYVLQSFSKPLRVQTCDCERSGAPSLGQLLYLFNDEQLMAKIADPAGRIQKLIDAGTEDRRIIEELYLVTLARLPTPDELDRSLKFVAESTSKAEGHQDVLWGLLNLHEFIINR